jgi:Domain of unknown function (DUF1996)
MYRRLGVLITVLTGLIAAMAVSSGSGTSTGTGIFHTVCGYSHSAKDDPIVHPGMPGVSHAHDFGGNATTNAYSTLASLQAGTTDCKVHAPDPMADRSGYWVPQMIFDGVYKIPFSILQVYYQSGGPTSVNTPPTGLELVAGNSHATGPQSTDIVKFTCSGNKAGALTAPPRCPSGSLLKIIIFTPNCLAHALVVNGADGRNDTSQAAYAVNGVCPTGFDPIAQARVEVKYPAGVDGRGTISFSSGPYYTMHADWFNGWDHATLNNFVQKCINPGVDCGTTVP